MRWVSTLRSPQTHSTEFAQAVRRIAIGCALIALLFSIPLFQWMVLGLRSDTESYLLLIPPISLYLIWTRKETIPLEAGGSRSAATAWGLAGGIGAARIFRRRCEGCHMELSGGDLSEVIEAPPERVLRHEECRRILIRTEESGL